MSLLRHVLGMRRGMVMTGARTTKYPAENNRLHCGHPTPIRRQKIQLREFYFDNWSFEK